MVNLREKSRTFVTILYPIYSHCFGKKTYWKIMFPWNFKFSPTLLTPVVLPPCSILVTRWRWTPCRFHKPLWSYEMALTLEEGNLRAELNKQGFSPGAHKARRYLKAVIINGKINAFLRKNSQEREPICATEMPQGFFSSARGISRHRYEHWREEEFHDMLHLRDDIRIRWGVGRLVEKYLSFNTKK